ncbi:hypothetical protein D9615_007836 [Tricholomella constricta]|uniref:Cytochrome P450 n=1 Tax=Tricholomella constricta TaxID=117010 RepID=A0A8H5M0T5_9AGAR|nr:hypothetical protein D9615_007836 [Tricholomella constricta]
MSFVLLLLSCAVAYLWFKTNNGRHPPLPPGPPADPIIGHLRLVPEENQEALFYEWGKIYGDVIHLRFLRRSVIVLNSRRAAVDLLERRSSSYSDRPRMGWVKTVSFMGYGEPVQAREARTLLQHLLTSQEEREAHLSRFSTAIIMQIAYGHQIKSDDDGYLKYTRAVNDAVHNSGSPGKYMPSWFPGTYYATFARANRKPIDDLHNIPFQDVQRQMAEEKAKASFVTHHLEARNLAGVNNLYSIEDIKGAAGTIYGAGAETTWSTMSIFFFAMLLHPECQVRAQQELDAVIGSARLPEFSDQSLLPYLECIMQETLRWRGALPLGVPHSSLGDDIYRGDVHPKRLPCHPQFKSGTLVHPPNADPRSFNPCRYLPRPDGNEKPYFREVFGFGRRICPGRYLADANLWIAMASILATFTMSPFIAEDGIKLIPEATIPFVSGLTRYQKQVGTVTVMRKDGKPLTEESIETIWMFHDYLLDLFGDEPPIAASKATNRATFDRFCQRYKNERLLNKQESFSDMALPLNDLKLAEQQSSIPIPPVSQLVWKEVAHSVDRPSPRISHLENSSYNHPTTTAMIFTQAILFAGAVLVATSAALPMGHNFDIDIRAEPPTGTSVARALKEGGPLAERSITSKGFDVELSTGKSFKRDPEALDLHSRAFSDEDVHMYQRAMDEELYGRSYMETDVLIQRSPSFLSGLKKVAKTAASFFGFKRDGSSELHARAPEPEEIVKRTPSWLSGLKKVAKTAASFFGFRRDGSLNLNSRAEEELYTRSEDSEALFARIVEDELLSRSEDELYSRDVEFEY